MNDRIPVSRVRALFQTIEGIGFFKLLDRYREIKLPGGMSVTVTESQTSVVSVTRNGESKRVEEFFGAPPGLKDLERQIDAAARAVLAAGADPLVRTVHGQTPLGRVVWESPDITEVLLKAGVLSAGRRTSSQGLRETEGSGSGSWKRR